MAIRFLLIDSSTNCCSSKLLFCNFQFPVLRVDMYFNPSDIISVSLSLIHTHAHTILVMTGMNCVSVCADVYLQTAKINRLQIFICQVNDRSMDQIVPHYYHNTNRCNSLQLATDNNSVFHHHWSEAKHKSQSGLRQDVIKQNPGNYKHETDRNYSGV